MVSGPAAGVNPGGGQPTAARIAAAAARPGGAGMARGTGPAEGCGCCRRRPLERRKTRMGGIP